MTPQAKVLLKKSINEYKTFSEPKKEQMVSLVRTRIKQHENAIKTIGTGYADYFVEAGRVFLRISDKL